MTLPEIFLDTGKDGGIKLLKRVSRLRILSKPFSFFKVLTGMVGLFFGPQGRSIKIVGLFGDSRVT